MPKARYEDSVFLNAPFDPAYQPIFRALIFAVHDCGFIVRCALEVEDSGEVRVQKIYSLIEKCKYGIHDICRAGIDRKSRLARFNMPLELGFFLGAKQYGSRLDRAKRCLVLDRERFRYQVFCSDIAGQDIRAHNNKASDAIRAVRNWLSSRRKGVIVPSASHIQKRFNEFRAQLHAQAETVNLDSSDLTFGDYTRLVVGWLKENPW